MHYLPIAIVVIISTSIAGALAHKDGDRAKCKEEMGKLMTCCSIPVKHESNGSKCPEATDDKESLCKYFECIFKEKGYMNEAGELNKEAMLRATEDYFQGDAEFMKVAKEAVEKVFEDAHKHKGGENKKCNSSAMFYTFRSLNHILRNCPASKWTNSQHCNDLKVSDACSKKN